MWVFWLVLFAGAGFALWMLILGRAIRGWTEKIEMIERKHVQIEQGNARMELEIQSIGRRYDTAAEEGVKLDQRIDLLESEIAALRKVPPREVVVSEGTPDALCSLWIVEVAPVGQTPMRTYITIARDADGAVERISRSLQEQGLRAGAVPFDQWKQNMRAEAAQPLGPLRVSGAPAIERPAPSDGRAGDMGAADQLAAAAAVVAGAQAMAAQDLQQFGT